MPYTVRVEQIASIPTAVVRRRAQLSELSHVVPQACGIVWDAIRAQSVQGAQRNIALYFDGEINLEAGVELDGRTSFAGYGEVVRSAMPGGTVATAVHVGPYSGLPDAHQAIRRWCTDHRCALAGPNWEIYGHWLEDETQLRTDVFYLLRNTMAPVHTCRETGDEQGFV